MSSEERGQSMSFLRLPVAAKRRRARPLLAVLARALRILVVLLPLAAVAVWILFSPQFALAEVQVAGTKRVEPGWVRAGALELAGRNLIRLDLESIERPLLEHEWIRAVEIRKRLPDRISIAVTEHRPAAVLRGSLGDFYLDRDGYVIARLPAGAEVGGYLLVLDRDSGTSAEEPSAASIQEEDRRRQRARGLELARLLESPESPLRRRVRVVEPVVADGFRLELEGVGFSILLSSESALGRARLLGRLLPEIERRFSPVQSVDLRYARRILIKSAAPDRGESQLG